jgi:hypothetical protein
MLEGAVEVAQEILAFTQARFQADVDAWKALTDCRNASDFLAYQKGFAEKVTAQYFNEADKIGNKMVGVLSKAAAEFQAQGTSA